MPKFFGEIKEASLENLAADPVANTQGRIWNNTTEGRVKLDSGTNKRAFLRNDDKLHIGNSGTAAENVRLNRAAASVLQFLLGSNVTPEGTLSAANLAQLSSRLENYPDASKPAPGNPGRLIYVTDLLEVQYDNGATWLSVAGTGSGGWGALGITNISANTVLTSGDAKRILLCDTTLAAFTVELPAASANFLITIKDQFGQFGTNSVTLTRPSPATKIEGLASDYVLRANYGSWNILCDGTDYYLG